MTHASRYHTVLVVLHWLLAVLIVAMLTVGFVVLGNTPNSDPQKITVLGVHMAVGVLVLVLMAARFVVRMVTAKPPAAATGSRALDRLAPLTHYGFYGLVLAIVGTGVATGVLAGLPEVVFMRVGALPASFDAFPTRNAHVALATLLAAVIALHAAAALYHQFVRRDGLLRRMGFGRREVAPAERSHA